MKITRVKQFGETEWQTFSGAVPFRCGQEPCTIESDNFIAVLDGEGVETFDIDGESVYRQAASEMLGIEYTLDAAIDEAKAQLAFCERLALKTRAFAD